MFEKWQLWGTKPELESKHNIERLQGKLSEMESTKQLVKIISKLYEPEMNVLDVGCNVGHYLLGLRKKFAMLNYTGVDAYEYYINEDHALTIAIDNLKTEENRLYNKRGDLEKRIKDL